MRLTSSLLVSVLMTSVAADFSCRTVIKGLVADKAPSCQEKTSTFVKSSGGICKFTFTLAQVRAVIQFGGIVPITASGNSGFPHKFGGTAGGTKSKPIPKPQAKNGKTCKTGKTGKTGKKRGSRRRRTVVKGKEREKKIVTPFGTQLTVIEGQLKFIGADPRCNEPNPKLLEYPILLDGSPAPRGKRDGDGTPSPARVVYLQTDGTLCGVMSHVVQDAVKGKGTEEFRVCDNV